MEQRKDLSDKDIGLTFKDGKWSDGSPISEVDRKFIFLARRNDIRKELSEGGKIRETILKFIKPKGNVLEGYVPSKAINRFQEEAG